MSGLVMFDLQPQGTQSRYLGEVGEEVEMIQGNRPAHLLLFRIYSVLPFDICRNLGNVSVSSLAVPRFSASRYRNN